MCSSDLPQLTALLTKMSWERVCNPGLQPLSHSLDGSGCLEQLPTAFPSLQQPETLGRATSQTDGELNWTNTARSRTDSPRLLAKSPGI